MSKGNNNKKSKNVETNKVKYYGSPVILTDKQKEELGIPVMNSKPVNKVEDGIESISAEDLKAKKSVMLHNIFKISSFAGISIGLITGLIVNLVWSLSFLGIVVSSVISVILLAVGVVLSMTMANFIKSSISGNLSKAGVELYQKLRVDLWIRNLSALIFMLVCAICFVFKLI